MKGLPGHPHVMAVTKLEHERVNFGGVWHSDTTYLERPPLGTVLYAVEVPLAAATPSSPTSTWPTKLSPRG
jgi:taurine dioxygenase